MGRGGLIRSQSEEFCLAAKGLAASRRSNRARRLIGARAVAVAGAVIVNLNAVLDPDQVQDRVQAHVLRPELNQDKRPHRAKLPSTEKRHAETHHTNTMHHHRCRRRHSHNHIITYHINISHTSTAPHHTNHTKSHTRTFLCLCLLRCVCLW